MPYRLKFFALFNRHTGFALLIAAFAALFIAGYLTRGGDPSLEYNSAPSLPNTTGLVDQQPLTTARNLAAQAATPQEQQDAEQTLRVADHEVDQAFATALRDATAHAAPLKGDALATSQKIDVLEVRIQAEKQHLADLIKAQPKAAEADQAAQQIGVAQAQLDLDNDNLSDLHQDLIRLGGDKHAKIQQALDEHEAVQNQAATIPRNTPNSALESPQALGTLPGKLRALSSLASRDHQLKQASAEALAAASRLTQQHRQLEKQTESASQATPAFPTATDAISTLHALSGQRKTLSEYDSRVRDEQQLAATYQAWGQLVLAQKRTVAHRIFRALMVIVVLLLLALLAITVLRRYFSERVEDHRRLSHMRLLIELGIQVFALAIILIVIFGAPRQMPAIIGLATAGITIVLKDFVVAFFGWFPLMGKNGIRVGDWVEINGVSGEVVEIGIWRTVLLETGDWADSGHPTGRRVTFMNSFAIEGRYFNFSTAGQWLWDELHVTVARTGDALGKIEEIRKLVASYTEADAVLAEQEWWQATKGYSAKGFTAAPAIDLRPALDSIEVIVRYITRAQKRYEVRSRLYQDLIQLLHTEASSPAALPQS